MKTLKYDIGRGDHKRHWISKYSEQILNVPNISRQKEIVKVLDSFNILVNDISNGLPKEIELRHKQYEYYRNELLNFKDVVG
jgi:type I restriction enzyme S subunit